MVLKLGDTRWWSGDVEPFVSELNATECTKALNNLKTDDTLKCTTCSISVGCDRFSLAMHYRSGWHRYNLRLKMRGKSIIPEEEYEDELSDSKIESATDDTDNEDEESLLPFSDGIQKYFTHEGHVFSVYKAILREGENVSRSVLTRPLDCAILLLSGGHFCGGIFKDEKLAVHKSFHRYTVRAKQGGTQSAADAKNCSTKKSAGAALRRYNEKALKEDIKGFMCESKDQIDDCPLVFIRVPIYSRSVFISDDLMVSPFLKSDKRLRNVPFSTRRPNTDELMRIWQRLKIVAEHGKVGEFRAAVEQERYQKKKLVKLQKNRRLRKTMNGCVEDEESSEDIDDSRKPVNKQVFVENPDGRTNERSDVSKNGGNQLTDQQKEAIYLAVRTNSLVDFHRIMEDNESKREKIIGYLTHARFPPRNSSFLHIAANNAAKDVLKELLCCGCDPCLKDSSGLVPYEVASGRSVRRVFSEYRATNPTCTDWKKARIPEPKVLSEEQMRHEAEKKRQQRERKKQREREKKQAEIAEKEQKAAREAFLALSDREKRALAAERRMATSLQKTSQVVDQDGNRCFQCGRVLPKVPFEYSSNWFCQISCVKEHRRANAKDHTSVK